ncbi:MULTISPECIES: hypothetical protein [unclassified Methylobacterium]|uniref:hypothetical protein n=1 Tax=unclassified Methylobacterium TaxID=2615210 RepID=UPI00070173E8|nr:MULTISPECIES: hypothetical protein [unclassified Methylobacterium]KQP61259.1 hypothetical protein ASF39_00720 [Methylobacterium sp. Leaf108]
MQGIVRRAAIVVATAAVLGASLIASSAPGQAAGYKVKTGYWPGAVAAGIAGTVVLGALAASAAPAYVSVEDEDDCYTAKRRFIDADGYSVVRRVRVCE